MILTDEQKVSLSVQPKTAAGNPAKVDGAPVWASSDPAIVSVEAAADGLSCVATAVGPLGSVQISVMADADLGEGVRTLTGVLQIDVQAAEAVSLNIGTGEPEVK